MPLDLSLRTILDSRYGFSSGFSVIKDVLGRAKNDIGEDFYRTTNGNVSMRFLLTTLVGTLTQHHNNRRTGGYLNEVKLTTSNVTQSFGKLFTRPVDGQIYAQPLYLPNVNIPGKGVHNVVYVATMHNTVYAFDADDPKASNPLWQRPLGPSVPLPDPGIGPGGYADIHREVGILGTPVISLKHNALYVVAFTKNRAGYFHSVHALDLTTGQVMRSTSIAASVPGTGAGSKNGQVTFTSNRQNQRPALLLMNNVVYIAFASYGDANPYHGWVLGYDATTLHRVSVYNTTPNGQRGGIWQAGQGPAADDSNHLYFLTGNGDFNPNGSALGDSIVKLNPNLTLADWFVPANQADLNATDFDLGSAGALLLPDTNLLVAGGKEGKFYLLDRNHMRPSLQEFYVTPPDDPHNPYPGDSNHTHHIHGGPVYWNGPNGPWIYVWPENDFLKAYKLVNGRFLTNPISQCTTTDPTGVHGGSPGMPGGMLTISANGNTTGTGIVWALHPYTQNANQQDVAGIMRAYDASNLRRELWNSKQNPNRDDLGLFAKFCPPTIANGKVYVATFSDHLAVYGLLH